MSNEKVLPFVEHLVELRKRLIVCVVAVVIGMGVAWNFSPDLLKFVEKPLTGKTYLTDLKKLAYQKVKERYPVLYGHYKLDKDLTETVKERQLNYSAPLEPFFIQCKISVIAGFILVLPVVFYQVWLFIAPGLTRKEKRLVLPFVTVSSISFCVGALFFLRLLARNRKYALLASAIIAAFHADLITMFVIMVPLYSMYEVSIWIALIFGKKKPAVAAA